MQRQRSKKLRRTVKLNEKFHCKRDLYVYFKEK
jgi:hypothetical protein